MAKADYKALLREFKSTKQTLKAFCESRALKYDATRKAFKRLEVKASGRTKETSVEKSDRTQERAEKVIAPREFAKRIPEKRNRGGQKSNQNATKHGGYARFHPQELWDEAKTITLEDELTEARVRKLSVLNKLEEYEYELATGDTAKTPETLLELLSSCNAALERITGRIESLERTLSGNRFTDLSSEVKALERDRVKASTEKTQLEANQIRRQTDGDKTELGDILQEITATDQPLLSELPK